MTFKVGEIVAFNNERYEVFSPNIYTTILKSNGSLFGLGTYGLLSTGEMADFGKHPFKEFYKNGITPDDLPSHNYKNRLVNWLIDRGFRGVWGHDLDFFWPNVDTDSNKGVYYWPNKNARMKGRSGRAFTKPGRFFKALCPDASDKEIEYLVEQFKKDFEPIELIVNHGNKREDFLHAYTHDRGPDRNFSTTEDYKRLCDSCMRHDTHYFNTPCHPVEAYASGDWGIFWTEDNQGRIHSRVTYYQNADKKELGPIYATSQEAINKLEEHLKMHNTSYVGGGVWEGARILKIEDCGRFVGPYFDNHDKLEEDGKYLRLSESGDIEHDHQGIYGPSGPICEHCEEHVPEDEIQFVYSVDRHICDNCLRHDFFLSDFDEEFYPDCEMEDVYYRKYSNYTWTKSQAEGHAIFCECTGEYWVESETWETEDGEYIPKYYLDADWFVCNVDCLAYPEEEKVETPAGNVAKCNYNEEGHAA